MREPKVIQIMPLPKHTTDYYTDQHVVGLALMDNGDIRPIVMYRNDDYDYFVDTWDPKDGAFMTLGRKLVERTKDIKAAKKELSKWDNKEGVGLAVLRCAKSIYTLPAGKDPQKVVGDILGMTPDEADLLLQGKKELSVLQFVDLCERLHVPIDGLKESHDKAGYCDPCELPF